ncbi:PAS domain S-box protein [uncultured Pseudodesulfovibrio sp.]|uniref:sensor domain-containing diguanylate cyclase n=1 Tax=uncultured Pseudodesulfovibrio sp. TaxID=2035858 RepID=UPI0029C8ADA1|nr:PAS domain S-box protein [uncultured Pseudodesulfovibrio sp.]
MDRLKKYIADNEEWFREHILAYAQGYGVSPDALTGGWGEFFSDLVESMPSQPCEVADADQKTRKENILSLFQSLDTPALILDEGFNVEAMNKASVNALGLGKGVAVVSKPLADVAPWLAGCVQECQDFGKVCRMDVATPMLYGEKYYSVSVSKFSEVVAGFTGFVLTLEDISFRVETEKQLSRERNRVAHYLDVVGSIIVAQDASGAITMVNRTGCQHLGYEEHELLGRNWIDLMIPDELRDEMRDYFYTVFSGQTDVDDEHTNYIVDKDGVHRLVHWQNRALTNDAGMVIGLLSSGVDVTEQRAMEDALSEKELWLRNTFVALGEAVLILTPNRKILDANPAAEVMFGMTNEELSGIPLHELHVDKAHYEDFLIKSQAAFDKREKALFEMALRRSDGTVFPADHSVSLILGDDGQPLGIVNAIRDISARKKAEQVLQESEEKFRRIFESIEEGYMVTDLNGIVQMVNPATCRLLGYEEKDLLGQNMGSLYSVKEERGRLRKLLIEKGSVRGLQVQARRNGGSTIVVEANAHLIRNDMGDPIAMEGTFRDITDRIEAEKILLEREKQYRAFFENNHAIMLLVDPKDERIIDANPAASEFYGYSVDEMRDMTMSQINVLTQNEIFREMQLSRQEGRSYFIMKHVLVSGDIRDVEVYSGPIMVQGKQRLYSVIHDITQRIRLEQDMKRLATTDGLTGVNNRHNFFVLGSKELVRAKRYKNPLSVLMLDIDYFKSINDTHGHQAGDLVLRMLAAASLGTLRETDIFGRLGGEEFAVILPETGLKEGLEAAERLREVYACLEARVGDAVISFTVSIGTTVVRPSDKTIEEVLNRADEALYKAKRMGRNRVERG